MPGKVMTPQVTDPSLLARLVTLKRRYVIVPMLIISPHPTRLTQLLIASLFVLRVALILAWLMNDAEGKVMIAATAAYATVLVVFVGVATPMG